MNFLTCIVRCVEVKGAEAFMTRDIEKAVRYGVNTKARRGKAANFPV